jgi:hypothetical protein
VFGSGRVCRNSCDFREPPCPARRMLPGSSARDSRRSPTGPPPSVPFRQAPAIALVACSCRITAIAAAPRLTRLISRPSLQIPLSPTTSRTRPPPSRPPVRILRAEREDRTPSATALLPARPAPRKPRTPTPNANPERQPSATQAQTERNHHIRGKPFLTASNIPVDYSELPTTRTSPERIEGVSRSLPYSDLLALTSSHMFFSVMN